jgi:hypothetical protein
LNQRWRLVTGCSSGSDLRCANVCLSGARVVCAARSVSALAHLKMNDPDSAIVLPLDVLHPGAIGLRWTRPCRRRAVPTFSSTTRITAWANALEEVDEQAITDAMITVVESEHPPSTRTTNGSNSSIPAPVA